MIKEDIVKSIKKFVSEKNIQVEHPSDMSYGDYSTNIALVGSKTKGENPLDFASTLVDKLKEKGIKGVKEIEVAGPGFINFYLSDDYIVSEIDNILKFKEDYGKNIVNKGKKIILEFTDPNPFKEFHIGHLMSNTIGESLSRIVEFSGAETKRALYQGDVGMHVAKAIWGIINSTKREGTPLFLGQAYTKGSSLYEEDEKAKEEINEINKKIYNRSDNEINEIYDWGRNISLDYFEKIYKRLGSKFDYYFFESDAGIPGKKLVLEWAKKGVFKESDGAYIFKGEKYGLHTRVFINSEGLPTYEAKELGLIELKYKKFKYDESIIITGNEINEYFKVLFKAMEAIHPDLVKKTKHIGHGMLRLPEGKMSSRTGNVITAIALLDEISDRVLDKTNDKDVDVAEKVAISAIKYSILKQSIGKDIIFDLDKSLSFEGDSGPYIQYTTVRANSVLSKTKEKINISKPDKVGDLEKLLIRFPEVVRRSLGEFAPQYITTYITEVASEFNKYYASTQIIDEGEKTPYRLALAKAVSVVLTNGLYLLGIKVPKKM